MRKVLLIILAMLVMPMAYSANPAKQLKKAKEKERKEVLKRMNKEGWKLLDTSHSLEVALLEHWSASDKPECREESGISTRSKSKSIGQQIAMNQVFVNYAQQAEQTVKGLAASEMNGSGIDTDVELETFYAAYKREVEKEIRGELKKSFSIYRENGDGTFEVRTFFVIDENSASKARIRAFENAIKESEAAQRHAQTIMDLVERNLAN